MTARLSIIDGKFRDTYVAMRNLHDVVHRSTLEPTLLDLLRVRVSQINGCGFCIDMHTKDARAAGETEQRLYLLSAWHEAPLYNARERAALAWAEAVTRLEGQDVPDDVYEAAHGAFSDEELVALTLAIVEINSWNRFSIAFRAVPGAYKPGMYKRAAEPRANA
jgi:AhpD family alkylhydroperoxidase